MAEESFIDVVLNKLDGQTDVGSSVYPGLSLFGDDLEDYMPFITSYILPIGKTMPGNHGGGINEAFIAIESWHKDDLTEARRIYNQARNYILANHQMLGTSFALTLYEFQQGEDDTGWETKHYVVRGAWRVKWSPIS